MGKTEREGLSTDLFRLQLWWTHARTRLCSKKYGFSLWTPCNTCVLYPATAEYTTRSTATGTELIGLFITTSSLYAGTFSNNNCFRTLKKVYKATGTLFLRLVHPRAALYFVCSLCFLRQYRSVLNIFSQTEYVMNVHRPAATCVQELIFWEIQLNCASTWRFFETITLCHTNMINDDEQTNTCMST